VLRDGQELSTPMPKTTGGAIVGRSQFQGVSFHDTPVNPKRAMRYVDATAKPGKKNVYAVIELNGAGIPSQPSALVSIE
jgi:hypothetical protein